MSTTSTEQLKNAATGTVTALAKKEPPKDFPAMLQAWKGEIATALPRHLNADRMARVALTCFRNVPKLAECNPRSVFAAVLQAAQLGIEPGLMGEAHLIPFKDTCQLIPGYQGLIKLAKQTGQVVDIYAMAVREKDRFACTFGLDRTIEHQPKAGKGGFPASLAERGEIIGVYAVAVFKDGTRTFVVMGRDETDHIRDNSQGYRTAKKYGKDSPWITHYEEMALKTAIRRLCKTLPKSPELAAALALEDTHNRGEPQNIDMAGALSGDYTPPHVDDVTDVDPETGEIITKDGGGGSSGEPAAGQQSEQQSQQPKGKKADGGPSINDALKLVNAGKYDEAKDLVKGSSFTDIDRAEVEAAIKKHKAGERV